MRCVSCGHGSLAELPSHDAVARAYDDAADPVSIREEQGQRATALHDLQLVEQALAPGRLLDVGCWTGSFVSAATERGWRAEGVEPSAWAVDRARQRGLQVRQGRLEGHGLAHGSFRLVVLCDVLEHLERPGEALEVVAGLLEPGGGVFVTVPDAGSVLARLLGRRWWSVLPMHLQYFTRASLTRLLESRGYHVHRIVTNPKTFSVRYYLERVGGYSEPGGRVAVRLAERLGLAERLVTPNLRDRLAVVATKATPLPP